MATHLRTALAYAAAVAALLGVFALYSHPSLVVTLSERLWACFN
jgi:hypothetical protein